MRSQRGDQSLPSPSPRPSPSGGGSPPSSPSPWEGAGGTDSRCPRLLLISALALLGLPLSSPASDFAARVIAYAPAPGQFINNPSFNNPARAIGPPTGGGTATPDNTSVVSLGGFGGSITLAFDHTVLDDPCNPFGLDAIVFSNAIWASNDPNRRFAEGAIIEISLDTNANDLADDPWFVVRGSHLPPLPASSLQTQPWDDSGATPTPPSNVGWYPSPLVYPGFPASYTTTSFRLPALYETATLVNPNGPTATIEGAWGYAELSPTLVLGDLDGDNLIDDPLITPEDYYTAPDNPRAVGLTPASAGGDAFDIAWAVDPITGEPASLPGFDFIRITTGVNFVAGALGELSAEIDGVADIRPREAFFDRTGDARAGVEDVYHWEGVRDDIDGDGAVTDADRAMLLRCVRRDEP
ncbi:MAG TPA: hypothetical protein DEB06_03315 [Phycisphaerales bacterium]|nr:hypothetical protein [Phycisphaerales bacterium]